MFIKVDKSLSWILEGYKWRKSPQGYIITYDKHAPNGKLHRLLVLAKQGEIVDHINGNKLDNRLANLRVVSSSQNRMNTYKPRGISKAKGVSWDRKRSKWKASIKYKGIHYTIGRFNTIEEASKAYRKKELTYFKEYARRR